MSDLIEIGRSGVLAYQYALTSVANNIANAAVEGYSRQEVGLASVMPQRVGVDYIGSGVYSTGIRRQYDAFVEANLQGSISELQGQSSLVTYANRAVDLLANDLVGLRQGFDSFFSSVRALGVEPGSVIARSTFLREADGIATDFRHVMSQWQLLDAETRAELETTGGEINSYAVQLRNINSELDKRSSLGRQPPELLDQRDNLLRELSELVRIKTEYSVNGSVKISVNDSLDKSLGGAVIVDHGESSSLALTIDDETGAVTMRINPFSRDVITVTGLVGGKMGGLLAFREQVLFPGRTRLDALAQVFSGEVNAVQRAGIDAHGEFGQDLFSFDEAQGAASSLELAFSNSDAVAAAAPLRVTPSPANPSDTGARISFDEAQFTEPSLLTQVFDPAAGMPSATVSREVTGYQSLMSISAGMRDVAVFLNCAEGQCPQLFTRDGRHLAGSELTLAQQVQLMGSGSMYSGATYSADYLNLSAEESTYLGADYFIGVKATPLSSPVYQLQGDDPHRIQGYEMEPARVQSTNMSLTAAANVSPIAAGDLALNGVALTQFTGGDLQDVADWLNGQLSATRVSAAVLRTQDPAGGDAVQQALVLTAMDVSDDIRLTFGAGGDPTDLEALGFATGLYWSGEVPEDLLIMVTSAEDVASSVDVSADFAGAAADPLVSARSRDYDIEFVTGSRYIITDAATGTVLADRDFDPTQRQIEYRGLVVTFDAAPTRGDTFRIDGNQDGVGDNTNIVAMAGLEYRKLPSGLTMAETYDDLASRIGNVAHQASIATDALAVVRDQAQQARQAVSGVSLDQEAADLIRYQQAYQANAKVMQVASDLFDVLLRMS